MPTAGARIGRGARGCLAVLALLVWLGPGRLAVAGLDVWTANGPEGGSIRALVTTFGIPL